MRSVMHRVSSGSSSRLLIVAASVLCSAAIVFSAGRVWLAARLAHSHDPASWMRSVKIEPGDAAYWNQLGLYEEWDFTHGNIQQSVLDFERATRLNPYWATYWTGLASAYEATGQLKKAREAYRKALQVYPASPDVAWQFGSFLLRQGQTQQAARKVRQALLDRPALATSAVSQFWNAGVGLNEILGEVLPARRQDYIAALGYFLSLKNSDASLASWDRLARLGRKVPLDTSFDLIDRLIASSRAGDAARVWRQALVSAGRTKQQAAGGSLVFNGGFEHSLANGGFGWRWIPTGDAELDLVGDITHSGKQSARVTFDGNANLDFSSLRQYVPVSPSTRYRFSAYMRTYQISTDSGPGFVIRTCGNPVRPLAQTVAITGTQAWTELQAEFTTGAHTQCVEIVLRRVPSQMFENKISGTAWVDDVRLSPAPISASAAQ